MMLSKHAEIRNQQRCIPPIAHEWLTRFGEDLYDNNGGCRVFLSKKSVKKMEKALGKHFVHQNKQLLRVYRVESSNSGKIITCGYRTKRLKR